MNKTAVIIMLLLPMTLFSDSLNMDKLMESKKNSFNRNKEDKINQYNQKRIEIDQKFNEKLKTSWEEFSTKIEKMGLEPKPQTLPRRDEEKLPNTDTTPIILPEYKDEKEVFVKKPEKYNFTQEKQTLTIDFFGDNIELEYPKSIKTIKLVKLTDKNIANSWEQTSKTDYSPLVIQLENHINKYSLNPWGVYLLVKEVANNIYRNENSRILFTAFFLNQLGHNCKISYSGNTPYLLFPSKKPLYGKTYLVIEGTKFYIISDVKGSLKKIKTYKANFPGVLEEFDLTVKKLPKLNEQIKTRELAFNYRGELNKVSIEYNLTLIEFFKDYPQTHYENYFQSELFYKSKNKLIKELKPLIENKSEAEAINILLHFVQKSFKYKTDQEQFRREKPLFPEETLHYKYSDCEDRSVLFLYLVKEMLGNKVIGLKYPGHMATAIKLKEPFGDTIKINNEVYTIADPTYINANIGISMPDFVNINPEIIGVN